MMTQCGSFSHIYVHVQNCPIEAHIVRSKLLNRTENRTPGHIISNSGLCLRAAAQYVLLFLVLAVNSDRFQILRSYTLLLKPPILMCYIVYATLIADGP